MNEMELLVRAGLIFSEALCQACNPSKAFLTDYSQSVLSSISGLKAEILADSYFEKSWQERTRYYDLKIDELVGKLADEDVVSSNSIEPGSLVM